jgi:zinc transport system permease protein
MNLLEILSYGFISLASHHLFGSVLGGSVLRRLSLIGDGLAHVTFGSTAIALALKMYSALSLLVTMPVVLLASLGILKLTEKGRLSGDAAIGLVSALGISAGIMLASLMLPFELSVRQHPPFQGKVVIAGLLCFVMLLTLYYHGFCDFIRIPCFRSVLHSSMPYW